MSKVRRFFSNLKPGATRKKAVLSPHPFPESPYCHQQLESEEIRILKIERIPQSQTLQLTTRPIVLADAPDYEAISYVWGTAPDSVPVVCNGAQLLVSPSTHEMLEHLRLRQAKTDRPLWIDAICINQDDANEKKVQIQLMQRIYMRAKEVVIWLGPSTPETRAFMTDFPRVAELAEKWTPTQWTYDEWWRGPEWPSQTSAFWTGLYSLLNHDWFRRLWTFQEVILARRAIYLYGNDHVDADTLLNFVFDGRTKIRSYLQYNSEDLSRVPGKPQSTELQFRAWYLIRDSRKQGRTTSTNATFHGAQEVDILGYRGVTRKSIPFLLHALRDRHVKEPVDRVWAIVGILSEDIQYHVLPFVDYSDKGRAEYWKTFIRFAKVVLGHIFAGTAPPASTGNLMLLSVPRSMERREGEIPSWCADLSGQPVCRMFLDGIWEIPIKMQPPKQPLLRSETEGHEDDVDSSALEDHPLKLISFAANDDLLRVRGFLVDTVSEVVEDPRLLGAVSYSGETDMNALVRHPLQVMVNGFYIQTLDLARRTCIGVDSITAEIPLEFLMCLLLDERVAVTTETAYRDAWNVMESGTWTHVDNLKDDGRASRALSYIDAFRRLVGHSFFSTTGGRFGIAYPGLKPGDKVCAFYGGICLYILRWPENPAGSEPDYDKEHARFCGPAFIPYLMKQHQRDAAKIGEDHIFIIE